MLVSAIDAGGLPSLQLSLNNFFMSHNPASDDAIEESELGYVLEAEGAEVLAQLGREGRRHRPSGRGVTSRGGV